MRRNISILLLALVGIVVLLTCIFCLRSCIYSTNTVTVPEETYALDFTPVAKNQSDMITIPSTSGIYLKSGQLEQKVDLYNPADNQCYFQITLALSDKTVIWKSGYIAPSESVKDITLLKTLERGIYGNCTLTYHCFSLDEKLPLNSASIEIEISST